ncbi:undecaprenyl-diphosphatase [Marininema mesophilum]|uniref:Undecaprenyl-diphosphatase n=1 Tax=Marininema mesophilum TaxID=1048340 RepID=A0A1H3C135_9BACL|nr:phosphatase PAP2 family protein [Marininema mesophilum]SDX47913.1 undecaprenyl-diphosphatase [Marininema mesophilum]
MTTFNRIKGAWLLFIYLAVALILTGTLIDSFFEVAEDVQERETWGLDQLGISWSLNMESPTLTAIMKGVTELGSVKWLLTGTVIVVLILLIRRQVQYAVVVAMGMLGTSGMNTLLKNAYERSRPENSLIDADGYSFPSGHSMGAISFFSLLLYLAWKSRLSYPVKVILTGAWLLLILLIGWSRVYLGAHYPTDVVAGYAAGATIILQCILVKEIYNHLQRAHR